jgi:hypothetical protein
LQLQRQFRFILSLLFFKSTKVLSSCFIIIYFNKLGWISCINSRFAYVLVTTAAAPITTLSHISTGKIVCIRTNGHFVTYFCWLPHGLISLCRTSFANKSLINTPWPIKQSSPMVTISQIKVWDCILVAQPIKTSFEFQQMAL